MVWRELYQDVALWRRVMRDAAKLYQDGDEHKLSAKVVGRWTNGAPLVHYPDKAPDGYEPKTARDVNAFATARTSTGWRCPLRHPPLQPARRTGLRGPPELPPPDDPPRDALREDPAEGVLDDDGADRGLVFVSFQASISRQFEGVQVQWLNAGNIFGLGHDKGFLLGDPHGRGKMTIQGRPPFFLTPQVAFVRTRGGEHLFVPGLTALAALADGTV